MSVPPRNPLVHTWRSLIREVVFKKLKFQQISSQSYTKAYPLAWRRYEKRDAALSLDAASSALRGSSTQWLVYFIHCPTILSSGGLTTYNSGGKWEKYSSKFIRESYFRPSVFIVSICFTLKRNYQNCSDWFTFDARRLHEKICNNSTYSKTRQDSVRFISTLRMLSNSLSGVEHGITNLTGM